MPVVYLIDERITQAHMVRESIPDVDLGFIIKSYASVTDIVSTVVDGLAASENKDKSIKLRGGVDAAPMATSLRIFAYGDCEMLRLGWGIHERNAIQLAPLASCLRGGASGECLLLGCNVALGVPRPERSMGGSAIGQHFGSPLHGWAGDELEVRERLGYRLLHALARTLGVPTTAALESQTLSFDCRFIGSSITVDPYGNATYSGMETPLNFKSDMPGPFHA